MTRSVHLLVILTFEGALRITLLFALGATAWQALD